MTPAIAPSDRSIPAPMGPVPAEQRPFVHGAYYPSWKIYRKQPPSCMDLDIITHVYYAFIRVREDGTIYHLDEKADLHHPIPLPDHPHTHGCLPALTHLRATSHPHLKLLLSLGGGSGSAPFRALASSAHARTTLAASLARFVAAHALDGVDLDWEHPSTPADGAGFLALLQALRAALPAPRYLVTAALPAGEWCLRHVPLAPVAEVVDAVNLMAYDFAGPWMAAQGAAGHHARLYAGRGEPCDAYAARSGHAAVEYVLGRGVPPRKVVLGVPVYGRSFLGVRGPGERFEGCGGEAGGVVEYRDLPREGAEEVVDEEVWGASCWVEGGAEEGAKAEWVSYDSPRTVREKARYVRERGLGGLFYWTGVADKKGEGSLLRAGYEGLYG